MTRTSHSLRNTFASTRRRAGLTLIEAVVGVAILMLLFIVLLPATTRNRVAARRTQCKNNLKQIGLALHNYMTEHGVFPPAYTVDENGQRLHSWRTLILPYLDQEELYRSVDLAKPWNDPANAALRTANLWAYRCPSLNATNEQTAYLALVTSQSCLRVERSLSLTEITDGPATTLLVVEFPATQAVPWMSPADADEESFLAIAPNSKTPHEGGVQVLMADGSARFLSHGVSSEVRRAMTTATQDDIVMPPDQCQDVRPNADEMFVALLNSDFKSNQTNSFHSAFGDRSVRLLNNNILEKKPVQILITATGEEPVTKYKRLE